jgi:hypothetical protein
MGPGRTIPTRKGIGHEDFLYRFRVGICRRSHPHACAGLCRRRDFGQHAGLFVRHRHGRDEFGIVPGISVAADFAYHGFRGLDGNSSTLTVHGLYDLSPTATVGLFYGQDRRDGGDSDLYGIEGATTLSGISVDGYLGRYEGDLGEGTLLGVNGAFAFTDAISATASAGIVNADENWKRLSIGGEYQFGNGPTVFAEVGKFDGDVDGENFISIGARIELGQGTTFGPRGITEILPGF